MNATCENIKKLWRIELRAGEAVTLDPGPLSGLVKIESVERRNTSVIDRRDFDTIVVITFRSTQDCSAFAKEV